MSARNLCLQLLTSLSLASAQVKQSERQLVPMSSGQLENAAQTTGDFQSPNALGNEVKQELPLEKPILRQLGAAPIRTFAVPVVAGKPVVGPALCDIGFNCLDHADQRLAHGGNQVSGEPPDHAMGANATHALCAFHSAVAVHD